MQKKEIESYIHDDTLKSLVISHWLMNGIVGQKEDVLDLSISLPNSEGVRTLTYNIVPDVQVINH